MLKYVKFALAAGMSIGLIVLPIWYSGKKKELTFNLQCESPEQGALAIFLIDVSDPFDPVDLQRARDEILDTVHRLPKGTTYLLLQPNQKNFYTPLEGVKSCTVPVLDEDDTLLLSRDDLDAMKRRRDAGAAIVRQDAERLLTTGRTDWSPLMETLIAISKRNDFRTTARRVIYIYSDMEQHSAGFSVYASPGLQRPAVPLETISLRGAVVYVKRIVRRTSRGTVDFPKLQQLWDAWFQKSNATVTWEK